MTEQEKQREEQFLKGRIPFFIDDNTRIVIPSEDMLSQTNLQ